MIILKIKIKESESFENISKIISKLDLDIETKGRFITESEEKALKIIKERLAFKEDYEFIDETKLSI